MSERPQVKPFEYSPEDPLAWAHAELNVWMEETTAGGLRAGKFMEPPLKDYPSGQRMLKKKGVACVEQLQAALQQEDFWRKEREPFFETGEESDPQNGVPLLAIFTCRQALCAAVAKEMLGRKPSLNQSDLIELIGWFQGRNVTVSKDWILRLDEFGVVKAIVQTITRTIKATEITIELRGSLEDLSRGLKGYHHLKSLKKSLDDFLISHPPPELSSNQSTSRLPKPQTGPCGETGVMMTVKRLLEMEPKNPAPDVFLRLGTEGYPVEDGSPLKEIHRVLDSHIQATATSRREYESSLEKIIQENGGLERRGILGLQSMVGRLKSIPSLDESLPRPKPMKSGSHEQGLLLLAAAERYHWCLLNYDVIEQSQENKKAFADVEWVLKSISESKYELNRGELFDLLLFIATIPSRTQMMFFASLVKFIGQLFEEQKRNPFTEGERYVLHLFRKSLSIGGSYLNDPKNLDSLTELIGDRLLFLLPPGEVWVDQLHEDLAAETEEQRSVWRAFIGQCLSATSSRPSSKWITGMEQILKKIGEESFSGKAIKWLNLFDQGRAYNIVAALIHHRKTAYGYIAEENTTVLRGILWSIMLRPQPDRFARIVCNATQSAFKKVPGIGPRAAKVGNAGVYALSQMGTMASLGQLAMLKVRVKSVPAQKEIEKAFNTLSGTLGLPREEIEELGVPSYGLEEVGLLREELGEYRGEVRVDGSSVQLKWFDAKGKELKSVPAKVKAEHKEELKDLQQSVKDISGMLPAQRERLDGMFCSRKTWKYSVWRERYLDHPLVGTIARRLIWNVGEMSAIFSEGRLVDRNGNEVAPEADMEVSLWHPIGRVVEEITGWRERLEGLGITQPFKQAHREIYLLTDAERNTNVYSNRFAAHIIRQHQFNALCGVRGWKNKLRMMVDAEYPPAEKHLPEWGLRAEYWIEGIGENYGTDTNEAGAFLRLATDQVRFYRTGAARNESQAGEGRYVAGRREELGAEDRPIPLEEIPPLVFSEVMRDVDLFVGVCSVANDPAWQDGGVVPQYRTYWESYSFGELSGGAAIRKEVLERLIPRLKIADRCSFAERFLVVRGSKRTYKIHLGSGNILMEPNDQYLCIVPDSKSKVGQGDLYLPFEGDNMLSIILSKALLLAEDQKIKDPTIVRQIEGV